MAEFAWPNIWVLIQGFGLLIDFVGAFLIFWSGFLMNEYESHPGRISTAPNSPPPEKQLPPNPGKILIYYLAGPVLLIAGFGLQIVGFVANNFFIR